METHFLADHRNSSDFPGSPWYNPYGDCIVYKMVDEAAVADRVDELLTIYRSAENNRPIGFQLKGVTHIRKFGVIRVAVSEEVDKASKASVSLAAVILAAYEERTATIDRRKGYATAMEFDLPKGKRRISEDELQPV